MGLPFAIDMLDLQRGGNIEKRAKAARMDAGAESRDRSQASGGTPFLRSIIQRVSGGQKYALPLGKKIHGGGGTFICS